MVLESLNQQPEQMTTEQQRRLQRRREAGMQVQPSVESQPEKGLAGVPTTPAQTRRPSILSRMQMPR